MELAFIIAAVEGSVIKTADAMRFFYNLLPLVVLCVSAYIYVREQITKLQTQIDAGRKEIDELKADLNNHKDKLDAKIDKILDKLDELRRDIHQPTSS